MGLHAARDDAFGQVARVRLQGFERYRSRAPRRSCRRRTVASAKSSSLRHRRQQLGFGDAARPFLAQNWVRFCRRCWTSWGSRPSLEMLVVCAVAAVPMKSDGESDIWPPECRVTVRTIYGETSVVCRGAGVEVCFFSQFATQVRLAPHLRPRRRITIVSS